MLTSYRTHKNTF